MRLIAFFVHNLGVFHHKLSQNNQHSLVILSKKRKGKIETMMKRLVLLIVASFSLTMAFGTVTGYGDDAATLPIAQNSKASDKNTIIAAYVDALEEIDLMRDRFKAETDVVDCLKKADHQLSDHLTQTENGLLSAEQSAYQYVADYIFLIHEVRLLTIFNDDKDGWADKLKSEEDILQTNLHDFQALNDPFTLQDLIHMADYQLINDALTEEEVVKASSISLSANEERSLIDMTGTWFAVIGTVTVLVVLTLIELHTSVMSTVFRRTKRRLLSKVK